MRKAHGTIRLTVDEYEQRIASAVRYALDMHTENMDAKIEAIKERKEKLRLALVEAGYAIPAGLNLEEWIPMIKGVR
mgnify:CR=1 FL=1